MVLGMLVSPLALLEFRNQRLHARHHTLGKEGASAVKSRPPGHEECQPPPSCLPVLALPSNGRRKTGSGRWRGSRQSRGRQASEPTGAGNAIRSATGQDDHTAKGMANTGEEGTAATARSQGAGGKGGGNDVDVSHQGQRKPIAARATRAINSANQRSITCGFQDVSSRAC